MLAVRLERTSSPLPTQPTTPTTDGRTRLERVGWLSGGLPATEAHHLRFVPSLIFFREDTWREPRGFPGQFSFSHWPCSVHLHFQGLWSIFSLLNLYSGSGSFWFNRSYSTLVGLFLTQPNQCGEWAFAPALHPYCITTWVICQGVWENFSDQLRQPICSLPLTMIVYHRPHQKSTGNNAQIREKKRAEVCVKCELIFFEQCDIMEILPGAFDLGQPKQRERFYPLPISTSTSS